MIILDINGIKHFLCMNAYNDISISIIISFLLFAGCIQEVKEQPKIERDASMNITKTDVGFKNEFQEFLFLLVVSKLR